MFTKQLMRDDVTGKLQRDNVSGKLMVENPYGDDCEYCDPGATPKYITLSISNLTDCIDYCFLWEGVIKHWKSYGVAAVLNGCVIILKQDPLAPCVWEKNYSIGDFGTLINFTGTDCTGVEYEYVMDELYFRVEKTAADSLAVGISLRAHLVTDYFNYAFDYNGSAIINDCINITNLNNELVCGDPGVSCHNGNITIVEGRGEYYTPPAVQYQRRLPTSDSAVQWSRSSGSNNYELVDDPYTNPDDDTTYTYTNTQTNKDLFSFTVLAVPVGSVITNVQVIGRFRRMEAGGDSLIRELLKVNGVIYEGLLQQLPYGTPSVFVDRSYTWSVNPNTGLAWTLDDINGIGSNPLQTFGYECVGYNKIVRCTQVYMKVNYEYFW